MDKPASANSGISPFKDDKEKEASDTLPEVVPGAEEEKAGQDDRILETPQILKSEKDKRSSSSGSDSASGMHS